MNTREAIQLSIDVGKMISMGYLGDLTDAELLVRAVPGSNHIAWQLGHLIKAENEMINAVCPGSMPALPAGWDAKYTNDTAPLDNASAFASRSPKCAVKTTTGIPLVASSRRSCRTSS